MKRESREMKKMYENPRMEIVRLETLQMLADSFVEQFKQEDAVEEAM